MGARDTQVTVLAVDPDDRLDPVVEVLRSGDVGTVEVVSDVGAAIEVCERRDVGVVLVLDAPATDGYDDVDGPTQVRELRALVGDCPIVAYVLREGHQPLVALFEAGVDDVCRVPPRHAELLRRKLAHVAGVGGAFDDTESQLRSLFDAYPQDVFLKDDLNRFVEHTGKADHLEPFEREWISNLTEFELFPEEFAEFLFEEEQQMLDGEDEIVDKVEHYLSPAGEDRWVSTTKVPRYDAEGNVIGIVGSSLDVTDVKRQERLMAALHDASRDLTRAETPAEIASVAVDIASTIRPLPRVQVAFFDDGNLQPAPTDPTQGRDAPARGPFESHEQWYRQAAEGSPVYVASETAPEPAVNLDLTVERVTGTQDTGLFVPLGDHGVVGFVTDGEGLDGFTIELADVLAANVEAALDRAERKRRIEETNLQLREFALLGSHELRNRLQRAFGDISRLRAERDSEHLDSLEGTIEGVDRMVSQLVTLARTGTVARATQSVSVATTATAIWADIETPQSRLVVEDSLTILADPDSFTELLSHLLRNAVEHAGPEVTVTIGTLSDGSGFYVEDDGAGIPSDQHDSVLAFDYDEAAKRSGYGLYIVSTIAESHDWTVDISGDDGTRVEISGVERPE